MNRNKLRKILGVIDPTTKIDFSSFDNDINNLKESFKQRLQPANFDPLISSLKKLKQSFEARNSELTQMIADKQQALNDLIITSSQDNESKVSELTMDLAVLRAKKLPDFSRQIKDTEAKLMAMIENAKIMDSLEDEKEKQQLQLQFAAFEKQVKDLKLRSRGGSMNRQIRVEGVDVLTKFTDINIYGTSSSVLASVDSGNKWVNIGIQGSAGSSASTFGVIAVSGQSNVVAGPASDTLNLVAGTNITLTTSAASNSITITSAGGGSVTGISRTASVITANTTGGTNSGTDYVYLANAGLQFTLPTAIGNNNLYTIKNLAASSVLVGVTAGQVIDGSATALLSSQYQSVDLISNGSVWSVI